MASINAATSLTSDALLDKQARATSIIRGLGRVAVAFSGGVDSTLVLRLAVDAVGRANVVAVTGVSGSLAEVEFQDARRLAASIGAEHVLIETHEFENPDYLANPVNRCYYCKTELYTRMQPLLAERGDYVIISGTNADDLHDYRPGLAAAGENAVRAPLAEAGLTKAEVRAISSRLGLPTHEKPAAPCLSSRVPYGEAITPEKLRMIERAESILHGMGFVECRVRHHDDLARIEVPADRVAAIAEPRTRQMIDEAFREIGYKYIALDLRGLRSGSLNEVIAFGRRQG